MPRSRDLDLLRSTLEIGLADSLERRGVVARTGLATFFDLELLFEPGQIMIRRASNGIKTAGVARDVILITPDDEPPYYLVKVDTVAWDGERFGLEEDVWRRTYFNGTKKVHEMRMFPLHMHPDHERITRKLIERGKKYESLRGQNFVAYGGELGLEYVSNRIHFRRLPCVVRTIV